MQLLTQEDEEALLLESDSMDSSDLGSGSGSDSDRDKVSHDDAALMIGSVILMPPQESCAFDFCEFGWQGQQPVCFWDVILTSFPSCILDLEGGALPARIPLLLC
jgi:hypothetical protein